MRMWTGFLDEKRGLMSADHDCLPAGCVGRLRRDAGRAEAPMR